MKTQKSISSSSMWILTNGLLAIHASLVNERNPQQSAKVRDHVRTEQTEGRRMLLGWFYIFIHTLHWKGDNERGRKTGRRGGNGVKHKERSFEKAPGLSRGMG